MKPVLNKYWSHYQAGVRRHASNFATKIKNFNISIIFKYGIYTYFGHR